MTTDGNDIPYATANTGENTQVVRTVIAPKVIQPLPNASTAADVSSGSSGNVKTASETQVKVQVDVRDLARSNLRSKIGQLLRG